jgi:hypothetical protein
MPTWCIAGVERPKQRVLLTGQGHFRARLRVAASSTGLTRFRLVSIASDFTLLNTVQQQKDRLPGGVSAEVSQKARKGMEEGIFSGKFRGFELIKAG